MSSPDPELTPSGLTSHDRNLKWFLRIVGGVSLLAFGAAVMPEKWIVEIAQALGFDPFPDSPLTFYLARNLSLLYGFVGGLLIIVSMDLPRYRALIRWFALGTILFGVLQLVVDTMAGVPAWWSLGESLSTFFGGILLFWLQNRCQNSQTLG
ncbi:MAG: hypothetical protein AB8B91_24825 [Rubripirellula sp.]